MKNWKDKFPKEDRYFETDNGILYVGDSLDILKKFPKNSVDLVLTDPPYLVNYKPHCRKNKKYSFCFPILTDNNYELTKQFVHHSFKLLKNKTAFYCLSSWKTVDFFKQEVKQMINEISRENDLVLDPFLGSGTTAIACEKLRRRWIGIELNKEYCEIAKQRLIKLEGDDGNEK